MPPCGQLRFTEQEASAREQVRVRLALPPRGPVVERVAVQVPSEQTRVCEVDPP